MRNKKLIKHLLLALTNIKERSMHRLTDAEIKLIKNSHLFDKLDEKTFAKLIKSQKIIHYLADDLILREGDIAHELYIIVEGSVRVFTISQDNKKIPLARLSKGDYFGEQALLGELTKTRGANVEAINDTTLIKINEKFILKTFKIDKELIKRLKKVGNKQIIENMSSTLDFYQDIKSHFQHNKDQDIIEVDKDHVLFKAGDLSDYVYIIERGAVNIILPKDGKTVILKKGHLFGELGVLNNTTRAATAIIAEPTRLRRINANDFKKYFAAHPKLKNLFNALSKTYLLPNRGLVEQSLGKIMGIDCITTVYKLNDGRTVIASHSLEKTFFVIEEENAQERQFFKYENVNNKIELHVVDNYIVYVRNEGVSDDLSKLCTVILDHHKIPNHVFDQFKATGEFKFDIPKPDISEELVCYCMSVKRITVEKLIEEGIKSLALISSKTGACTVCGSCRVKILDMLGQVAWVPAVMTEAIKHKDNVSSYYINSLAGKFNSFNPGQHIVIQVRIDGIWVERAYTLSDLSEDGKLRVTIKKEKDGFFTKWLLNSPLKQFNIYCSQPQGNFILNPNSDNPILCFAGGIGITPFITFAKMLQKQQNQRQMHLIYVAPTKNDLLFMDEFADITAKNSSITLMLWEKRIAGLLPDEIIFEAVKNYKDCDIYICGPEGFEVSIINTLKKINYNSEKIHIEKFTYANPIQTKED